MPSRRKLWTALTAALAVLAALVISSCAGGHGGVAGGPWQVAYDGYGRVGGTPSASRITLRPARSVSPGVTHAALALSARSWGDVGFTVRLRTTEQLRRPAPNPWEVGWLVWHYASDQRFYYLVLRAGGWELGKKTPGYQGNQRFLATGTQRRFPIGRWYTVRVNQRGGTISVAVDGRHLVSFTDRQSPYLSGRLGLYSEDASVTYQPVAVGNAR